MARPKIENPKDQAIMVRLTKDEKQELMEIIEWGGYGTISNFVRKCIQKEHQPDDETVIF